LTAEERSSVGPASLAFGDQLVLAAKLAAPRPKPASIERPRLARKLLGASQHPLTIVRAGAGYGKTTALAHLAALRPGTRWYGLGEADRDPLVFLLHLIAGFAPDGARSVAMLELEGGAAKHWARAVDALANDLHDRLADDVLLILDDFHLAEGPATQRIVERLVEHGPATLHVVLGTRRAPSLARMARWHASGDILEVGKGDLAFAVDEVSELFWARRGEELAEVDAERLLEETDGWPIALNLLSQGSSADPAHRRPADLDALFEYLAEEVFEEQSAGLQDFLLGAAALRRMDAALCDELLERTDSAARLAELDGASLFVTSLGGGGWRLHPLFGEFLAKRAQEGDARSWSALHRRACSLLRRRGDVEEAIHHAFVARTYKTAGELLEDVAAGLVLAGRYETLEEWINRLPDDVLDSRPELLRAKGDAARLTSRFDIAVTAYARARERFARSGDLRGERLALEGEALVYLDTVRPSEAGPLLRAALRLVTPEDDEGRAHLLYLLAENSANHGDLERAERIQEAAGRLVHAGQRQADPRLHLRRGRLAEARALAERQLRREEAQPGPGVPRSHRESTAVLAWIAAFSGDAEEARAYAEQALVRGREMHAPIVEALALCRLGHGWLTGPEPDPARALELYTESLAVSERIGVDRFRAEALLGRVVANGRLGAIEEARVAAREAIGILEAAGDRYLSAVVWLALGAAGVRADHPEAASWLEQGTHLSARSGDGYCLCLADIWRALLALRNEDWEVFDLAIGRALADAGEHGRARLLVARPFLGVEDAADQARLLRAAARRGVQEPVARRLLMELMPAGDARLPEDVPYRVCVLGRFEMWERSRQITPEAWSRDKALALFQLLVLHRGRPVHREHLQETLWPDSRSDASALSLRVALNALNRAVAPEDDHGESQRLVLRQGSALRLVADLVRTDLQEFEDALRHARAHDAEHDVDRALAYLRRALAVYRGDLLEDRPYEEWVEDERRALRDSYLRAATRAAELMVQTSAHAEALEVCEVLLARDPCWEAAYVQQIRAHVALGNRALAVRAYERCVETLREQLDLQPSPDLTILRDTLLAGSA
jgi:LuxR family transcriptional regulator, maltose regulon positive regulatory protein